MKRPELVPHRPLPRPDQQEAPESKPERLSLRQLQAREGYFYDPSARELLRLVGPADVEQLPGSDAPRWVPLVERVVTPLEEVCQQAMRRFSNVPPARFVNIQTARQADGTSRTEVSGSDLRSEPSPAGRKPMRGQEIEDELETVTIHLPQSICREIERLVPVERREQFYRLAIERELLLREDSE